MMDFLAVACWICGNSEVEGNAIKSWVGDWEGHNTSGILDKIMPTCDNQIMTRVYLVYVRFGFKDLMLTYLSQLFFPFFPYTS